MMELVQNRLLTAMRRNYEEYKNDSAGDLDFKLPLDSKA